MMKHNTDRETCHRTEQNGGLWSSSTGKQLEGGVRTEGNCLAFDRTKSKKPTPSCFLPALHHASESDVSSFRVPATCRVCAPVRKYHFVSPKRPWIAHQVRKARAAGDAHAEEGVISRAQRLHL